MSACPNCFHPLSPAHFAWVCTTGRCEQSVDPLASRYAPGPVRNGTVAVEARPEDAKSSWRPTPQGCQECGLAMAEACPDCHSPLLPSWRESQVTCIAMNGARATGKSLYIGVAVKQLQQLAPSLGTVLSFADETTHRNFEKEYERPLYTQRGLLGPTPRATTDTAYQREPLVFDLGMVKGRRRYLVFRDIAGEDMEQPPADSGHLDFLAFADGVVFLFDPLAVPSIKEKLVDLIPPQLQSGGDPQVVLHNLLRLIEVSAARHPGVRRPRIAVVLSKFDAMQMLRRVDDVHWRSIMSNLGGAFARDAPPENPTYDEDDGALLHEEAKSLLIAAGAQAIVLSLENPSNGRPVQHRFFAASALGASPDGARLNTRGIAPFRLLDPVKWILASTGVL